MWHTLSWGNMQVKGTVAAVGCFSGQLFQIRNNATTAPLQDFR